MIRYLKNLINHVFSRGKVTGVDGSKALRTVQLKGLFGDVREDVEHLEPYGFTSEPHIGAEAAMLSSGGDRDHTVAIIIDDRRYRIKAMKAGEVAMYDDLGRCVYFKRDQVLVNGVDSPVNVTTNNVITMKGTKIVLDAPVETTSTIKALSDITDRSSSGGKSMQSMRSTFNSHTHQHGQPTTSTPNQSM